MFRFTLPGACVLAVATMLVPTACAGSNDSTSPPSTQSTVSTPTAAAEATATSSSSTTLTSTPTEAVRTVEVTYAGGQVAGGAQRTTVRLGERVRIRVTSDVADVVHVHTYDKKSAVSPGQPAQLELVASIPGRHEVELENKRRQLLTLEVK